MAVVQGGLIEIADYNDLALEVNRLYSDTTSSLAYSTSNLVLNDVAAGGGEAAGATRTLSPEPVASDFLVVVVDDVTLLATQDYVIDYNTPVTITYNDPLAPSAILRVYNRNAHRYGWGQQASVHPISATDPILADEAVLQAYLEANVNNLIDKVNIMEDRIDGPTVLTRVAQGALIYATDKSVITSTINADVLSASNYWSNQLVTVTGTAESFTRTADWSDILIGEMRHTWSSYDSMRYFFNTGNDVRANIVMTGLGANQGFNNWNQVAQDMGSLIINYSTTTQTGTDGITSNLGAFHLTNTYQTIFTSASPSAPVDSNGDFDAYSTYNSLVIIWEAKLVENAPSAGDVSIDIRVTMNDQSLNVTTQGTTTYNGGYALSDNITDNSAVFSVASHAPILTVTNNFESGDDT